MSNSKSESESSFFVCDDLMFFGGLALVDVAAERMRDEGSSSRSSRSSSSSSSFLLVPGRSGRSNAPVTSRIASSSGRGGNLSSIVDCYNTLRTFYSTLAVSSPCDELLPDFSFSIYDDHWHSRVGKVWDTLVPNDRHKFCSSIALC